MGGKECSMVNVEHSERAMSHKLSPLQHRELSLRPRVALGGGFLVPFPCRC